MVRLGRAVAKGGGGRWAGERWGGSRRPEVVEEATTGEGLLGKKRRNKWAYRLHVNYLPKGR
jgi:hypothetical protein